MLKPFHVALPGALRAFLAGAVFALCSGVAYASTLDVALVVTNSNGGITSAELDLISSTDLTNYSGTLVSCTTKCGPPTTGSGELDDGMGHDSTIVTTGTDAETYDLIYGSFTQATNPTSVVLTDGVVTSISFGDYITSNNTHDQCGFCLQSLTSTEIAVLNGVPGPLVADLSLPPAPIPLPAALSLVAGGLGLIGLSGRRRKRIIQAAA